MSTAAIVVIVSDSYLGREVTIGAAVSRVVDRFWSVLAAVLLQGLIIGFGFFLLIIGAIIFACWYFATTNVVMVEGKGAVEALGRSKALAKGSVGTIFGTLLLAVIPVWLIYILIAFVLGAAISVLRTNAIAAELVASVVAIFIVPFVNVVVTLLYYDLRIRKEGFDLELMAKELGFAAPAQATA